MKKTFIVTFFALFALHTLQAQDTQGKRQRGIIKEWGASEPAEATTGKRNKFAAPPAETNRPNSLKQDASNVSESGSVLYKTVLSFTNGATAKPNYNSVTDGVETNKLRLVLLFKAGSPWANLLEQGDLKINNDKIVKVLEKYNLYIDKYYAASANMDGLVLRCQQCVNIEAAAKELSRVEGISVAHVKVKK
jgi:hypothetical protein